MRASWNDFRVSEPEKYELKKVSYGAFPEQEIYLALPKGKKNFPVVVWYHGGGLTGGERECPFRLWNGEYATAEVRYRLSGSQFKGTDSLQDAVKALAWVIEHIASCGGDPAKIFVGGMSAGAYLAAMVGMAPHLLGESGHDFRKLAGLLIISGQMTTHFQIKEDLGYEHRMFRPVIDELAPLYYASPEVPPCIFVTGDFGLDMPARAEENAFLAATLRVLGHKDAEHFSLRGHDHGGAFESCGYLILRFMDRILKGL